MEKDGRHMIHIVFYCYLSILGPIGVGGVAIPQPTPPWLCVLEGLPDLRGRRDRVE